MKGMQSQEVEDIYERARSIGTELDDKTGLFKATWGLWLTANVGRNLEKAGERAQELVTLGQNSADPELLLEAFHCRWSTAYFRGDVATALKDSREGAERYDPAQHSWMGAVFGGHDPGVCANQMQAQVLCLSGFTGEGKKWLEKAVSLAEMLKHPHSMAFALMNAMVVHQMIGNYEAVHQVGERLIELADKYNFPPQRAHALMLSGWAMTFGTDVDAGVELMEAEFPEHLP